MLIVRRAKLYYTVSGIITPIGGRPVHGQQNIKIYIDGFFNVLKSVG